MPSLSADFDTRRDAEMAVEHMVQEHGLDPKTISVVAISEDNSAGTRVSGSDVDTDGDKAGVTSKPALAGRLRVSVETDSASSDKVLASFAAYGGREAPRDPGDRPDLDL